MIKILLFALLAIVVNISADHHNYGYGYDNYDNYNYGFKKENIDRYGSNPYLPPSHGPYGHHYGWKLPVYKNFYSHDRRPYIYKRLPPIYKTVKQPVYVEQPVIIRKVPVIHKRKEVTVKKLPPIYDVQKPTVIEKDVGVGVMPAIEKIPIIPKEVIETPKDVYDVMPSVVKEPEVKDEMIGYPKGVHDMEGFDKMHVKSDMDVMYELDQRMKGFDKKDVEVMKDVELMKDVKDMEIMKDVELMKDHKDMEVMKEVEIMKDVKSMEGAKEDGFGDYNPKDFDISQKY